MRNGCEVCGEVWQESAFILYCLLSWGIVSCTLAASLMKGTALPSQLHFASY